MTKAESQALIQAQKDAEYLNNSYDSLKKEYTNQYIAIKDGGVIANHENIATVIKILRVKKLDPAEILIEFVSPKDMLLIL